MEETAIEVKVQQLLDSVKHIKEEIAEIYDRLREVEKADAVTQEQYKHIIGELESQKGQLAAVLAKLDDLSRKPEKRYESAVTALIGGGVGAAISYISQRLFGG